jgi:hypothetical protein
MQTASPLTPRRAAIHRGVDRIAVSKRNLRHADADDCRANDAMKVYKRWRQKWSVSTAILTHSTT